MTWPTNILSIDLALVPKRLLITAVNDTPSKRDTLQQASEDVLKKTGYICYHNARYEVLTVVLMKTCKYSGMCDGVLTFRSCVVPPSSR
jgi:hypothetical protein